MPKSNYPNKLDTSIELPAVRDNITEIGSDVINSLRSAIFQIEKTLGINPQGAAGNSLASRLSNVLDENGNLLKDALDRSNVLSGPILDSDVSEVAAIREKKLRLDFPTQLLQDEISIINGQLDNIIAQLTELSSILSVHIHPSSTNRHKGIAITIDSATVLSSDTATLSLDGGTSQSVFENIYNAHMNYSGANISSLNNSHAANQIYFDNEQVETVIPSSSVQGAIEDLAGLEGIGLRNSVLNLHSNGRIRTGSATDQFENNQKGSALLSSTSANYILASGASTTTFTIVVPALPIDTIEQFDILTVSNAENDEDDGDYQIKSVDTDVGGEIISIEVFGGPSFESADSVTITVYKNIYTIYNENGLNCAVRPRSNRSNTPDIQAANPNSATIISTGIEPAKITASAHTFDITIDGGSAVTIETYDATVSEQTFESIVNKINEQAVDQHLNFMAYKLRVSGCFEIAITHNLPNSSDDIINRTIQIDLGSTNDGTAELGFDDILGLQAEGTFGNTFHINGLLLDSFGLVQQLAAGQIVLVQGTNTLSLLTGNFSDLGVRIGDTLVLTGSTSSADDGSFRVKNILNDILTVDLDSFTFAGALDENSSIHIVRNSARVDELTFTESVSADGSIIFDVFLTDEKDIHFKKRLEIDGALSDSAFTGAIVNVSKNFIVGGQTATVVVGTDGYATLTGPSLLGGEPVYVATTGTYKIFARDRLSFITLNVKATGAPLLEQTVDVYGFDEVSRNNLALSRGLFGTSLGRVLGESGDPGVPSIIDRRHSGTVDQTIIGESFLEKYIEGPRNELRGTGIIRGCEVSNVSDFITYQTFDVSAGIAVVNGIRYEIQGFEGFRVNSGSDIYVALDALGCVIAGNPITNPDPDGPTPISPFTEQVVAHLAFIDIATETETDLRLLIDHIDYKLVGDIKVSNDERFGHFTSIKGGVDYARRFSKMFPELGDPSVFIDEGTHLVDELILVDFDTTIRGAGQNTIIKKTGTFAEGTPFNAGNIDLASAVFLVGGGTDASSDRINNGVTFRDFTYITSDDFGTGGGTAGGSVISITQRAFRGPGLVAEESADATFRIENINFVGPSGTWGEAAEIGEFAVLIGRAEPTLFVPSNDFTIANVFIKNCYFRRMGLERGAVRLIAASGAHFRGLIFSGNIASEMSPNIGDSNTSILENIAPPAGVQVHQIIETSNVIFLDILT